MTEQNGTTGAPKSASPLLARLWDWLVVWWLDHKLSTQKTLRVRTRSTFEMGYAAGQARLRERIADGVDS